jgi:hypothetical protein
VELELAKLSLRKTEIELRKTEVELEHARAMVELERIKAHAAGVRGVSITASQLAKTMAGVQIEPWFAAVGNIKFDEVSVSENAAGGAGDQVFTTANRTKQTFFTQDGVKEKPVQAAWSATFSRVCEIAAANGVNWWDGHATFWLKQPSDDGSHQTAPDAVAVENRPVSGTPDPHLVLAFSDNKDSCSGRFTEGDKGTLFKYCVATLQFYQPQRPFMPCSLFDGQYAQCFKVVRTNLIDQPYVGNHTRVLNLSQRHDSLLYAGFLSDHAAMAFNLSNLHNDADICIGSGATGLVFSDKTDTTAVIKIPFSNSNLQIERNVYSSLPSSPGLPHLHSKDIAGTDCLVLQPKFERMGYSINVSPLCSLIDTEDAPLRVLHKNGWLHCDLRPENIMAIPSSTRLALVDMGAARRIGAPASLYEHGTLTFASPEVQTAHFGQHCIQLSVQDDLISLARCAAMLQFHSTSFCDQVHKLGRNENHIRTFWAQLEGTRFLTSLMEKATACDYDGICTVLLAQCSSIPECECVP